MAAEVAHGSPGGPLALKPSRFPAALVVLVRWRGRSGRQRPTDAHARNRRRGLRLSARVRRGPDGWHHGPAWIVAGSRLIAGIEQLRGIAGWSGGRNLIKIGHGLDTWGHRRAEFGRANYVAPTISPFASWLGGLVARPKYAVAGTTGRRLGGCLIRRSQRWAGVGIDGRRVVGAGAKRTGCGLKAAAWRD